MVLSIYLEKKPITKFGRFQVDFKHFYHFFENFEKLLKIIENFHQNKFGHFCCRFGDIGLLSSKKGQKCQP